MQRNFTKRLPGYFYLHYKERLARLGIDSLEMRRLRHDLIYCYKVVFGLVDGTCGEMFTLLNSVNNINTRGHIYKLFPHYCRVDARKYFFSERVIDSWNNLPAKTEHFKNLATFKRFILTVDLSCSVTLGFYNCFHVFIF